MKKMLIILTILISIFTFDAFALEYKTVNISVTFSEEIEFSDVEKVKLTFFGEGIDYVDDASSITNIVELTKDNDYFQTINNVKIVDQSNLFAIVDKDNYGTYNCEITLDTSVIDTANITIYVSKNNLPKDEYSTIPSDILEKIIGSNTPNKDSENTNNNDENNNNHNKNNNGDSNTTTNTTDKNETIIYKEELKKREEQEKIKKKNNTITIALFVILGIIILIALVFVMYKFVTANK